MSYNLAVFEPRIELRDRSAFISWYRARVKWDRDAFDSCNATPALRAWYEDISDKFPSINAAQLPTIDESERWEWLADYSFAWDLIYVGFPSGKAEVAHEIAYRLAAKHCIGFLDVSGNGDAQFPEGNGRYIAVSLMNGGAVRNPEQ